MASPFDRSAWADTTQSGIIGAVTDLRSAGLTYEPFYGLREKPFSLASDARFFYQSRSHAPAFDDLLNAIKRRESLTVLTGDIGTGKTTVCRAVLHSLDRKTFSAFAPDPFVSREDLLKVMLTDFGVASAAEVASGRLRDASRTELTYLLHDFLGTLAPQQAFAVVFVDEAQNLSLPLLEELRILSDSDGQLQVVLVGQLELDHKLKLTAMRQLDQRISARCALRPLDVAGVSGYISHRLHRAGGSADRISFSGDAVEAIYDLSGGVPRVINRLCDRALQTAQTRRAAVIDREIVAAANPGSPAIPSPAILSPAIPLPASPSTASPSTPVPTTDAEPHDPFDVWLNSIDDPAPGKVGTPVWSDRSNREDSTAKARPDGRRLQVRIGYVSHAQSSVTPTRVPRKWTRRLELLTLTLVLLLAALMIGPSVWDAGADAAIYVQEQFEAPGAPSIPQRPALHLGARIETPRAMDPLGPDPSPSPAR